VDAGRRAATAIVADGPAERTTETVLSRATMAGLMDIALHPNFSQNKWIYISYHKPIAQGVASNAILRGTWDGKALTDVRDVFGSARCGWAALSADGRR
jgi:glucose/arabinose dehydrogenase